MQDPTENTNSEILLTPRRNRWRKKLTWLTIILNFVLLLIASVSNRFFYLSHERFPLVSKLQWKIHSQSDNAPLIIGHRGAGFPSTAANSDRDNQLIGNTLKGIKKAIDAKVDWIEIDIRMSKENERENGKLVVFHDANVAAKTDFNPKDFRWIDATGEVADLNLLELKTLNLLVKPSQKILTLDEVFESSDIEPGKNKWIFDLKATRMKPALMAWLENKIIPSGQLTLFGEYEVLKAYKHLGYPLGYTTLFGKNWKTMLLDPSKIFDRCDDLGSQLVVVPILFVTTNFIEKAAKREIKVWCYDSNDEADLKYAVNCGVEGVIVDRPDQTMAIFKSRKSSDQNDL
ncbi:glycerophosphodiester phosphodiesterase [bacterium]|nr:glycerophosphodiester phosphodiesterase [bacterium]MDC0278900.1 glycerophosphodiester phosphodiesterase [bacterium]